MGNEKDMQGHELCFTSSERRLLRAASGDATRQAGSRRLKVQGEARATHRYLAPCIHRWHLSRGSGQDFWPEDLDQEA